MTTTGSRRRCFLKAVAESLLGLPREYQQRLIGARPIFFKPYPVSTPAKGSTGCSRGWAQFLLWAANATRDRRPIYSRAKRRFGHWPGQGYEGRGQTGSLAFYLQHQRMGSSVKTV